MTHTKPRFAGEADEIDSLSCPSTRNCAAVGIYSETHGSPEGLLLTTTRGRWTRGIEAQLPGNAAPPDGSYLEPVIGLGSVSCGSPNDCTATGGYADDQSNQLGMTLSEHTRRWAPGEETPLPADAGPNPQQGNTLASPMNAIACPSAGMCSAVGYYLDKSDHNGVLLLNEQTGAWTPSALVLPPGADAALGGGLVSLACPSAGNCLAVGYDNTGINRWKPMLATEQGGHWIQGTAAPLPSGVRQKNSGDLESVACPSATTCVAVGSYGGIGGTPRWGPNWHGLIVTFRSS